MSFLADLIDNVGTAFNAPDLGFSEAFNGNKATSNTGRVPFTSYDIAGASNTKGVKVDNTGKAYAVTNPNIALINNAYNNKQVASNGSGTALNADNTNGTGGSYGGGYGGSNAASAFPDLSQYDQAISTYQNQIGRLGSQLDIAKGNIQSQFNTNQNELNSAKNQAQNTYNTQTTQNGQQLRTTKNTIADQASAGLRGLLHTLGAYGAGGSSDALYNAPTAVANQASLQRSGAGQTFAQNQQNLDTNWNNFQTQDKTSRDKLTDWFNQQTNSTLAQSESTKQSLLSKLADLVGQRTAAAGGRYASGAQPYLDQANSLAGEIDNLGRINPTYNGTTPTYTAPTLDSYNAGNGTAASIEQNASNNPYLALLLGQQRDKNTQFV